MGPVEEFYHDFQQDLKASASANADFLESQFAERMAGYMEDAGDIEEFNSHFARDPAGQWRADGYAWDENTGTLSLFLTDYRPGSQLHTLIRTEAEPLFKKALRFLKKAFDPSFLLALEETSAVFEIANLIQSVKQNIYKVNVFILSNGRLSERFGTLVKDVVEGLPVYFNVWDITRAYRLESARSEREDLVIDFTDFFEEGLNCLSAGIQGTGYTSYLIVLPGDVLARLYGKWGSRLLEQNVRNFLQARGKVNKGIRDTIKHEPWMFFAYNNGITATAADVEIDYTGNRILSIRNLQIVNGAQTTASLFNALHKDKADLNRISVQMKLSVIDSEQIETIVPKISRYANSQNKVSEADFFSNHPFHQRIEEKSRRIWSPAPVYSQQETKWFYERTRGQYLDQQSNMTPAEKRKFRVEYPRAQMFTKTDLAKYENVWSCVPHEVSRGAQKNFGKFAHYIEKRWNQEQEAFNDVYYRELIAKVIAFRTLEKLVSRQPWYLSNGTRSGIVAYTISFLAQALRERDRELDFHKIWKKQEISAGLKKAFLLISEAINAELNNTRQDAANGMEYAKREGTWLRVRELNIELPKELDQDLVSPREAQLRKKNAAEVQKIDDGIAAQAKVMELGDSHWKELAKKMLDRGEMTQKIAGILEVACRMSSTGKIPSERQSKILLKLNYRLSA